MQVDLVQAKSSLIASIETLEAISDWRLEVITEALLTKVTTLGIKNGQLLWPLRAALSGQQFSPGAFELAWVLGKDQSIERINLAINKIK